MPRSASTARRAVWAVSDGAAGSKGGATVTGRARGGRHPALVGGVALTVLVLDQLTKSWAVDRLSDGSTIDVIGSLRFNLAFNSGAAFSQGTGLGPWIALVAIGVVIALVWTSRSATSRLGAVAIGLVVGGALGNVCDRLLRDGPGGFLGGAVVDFIDLQWWPIFNIADSAVVVGGLLLLLSTALAGDDDPAGDDEASGAAGADPVPAADQDDTEKAT